jgi:SPP1 gp7 family putative phage head morphogenesis protein
MSNQDSPEPITDPKVLKTLARQQKAEQKALEKKLKVEKREADRVEKEAKERLELTVNTRFYSQGRYNSFRQSSLVTHWRLLAIDDDRCCEICRSRNGCIWAITDTENMSPCHEGCRCTVSSLMPKINPKHQEMIEDPTRQPQNRNLVLLPDGWSNGIEKD